MNDLLEEVIEAHGGLERWNQLDKVSARLSQGGALWALKGQPGVLDDVSSRRPSTRSACRIIPSAPPTGAAASHQSACR